MKLVILFVFLGTISYTYALSCAPCPEPLTCSPLRGCEKATRPCGCCPVCALGRCARCGALTQRCRSGLWCAKKTNGKVKGFKQVPWWTFFNGRCTEEPENGNGGVGRLSGCQN